MVLYIPRGPIGTWVASYAIDPGTLKRTTTPLPGPVGLKIGLGIPMQVKATAHLKPRGIAVHAQSQISAQEWVKKIKNSGHVPHHYQKPLMAKGNIIILKNPLNFKIPKNIIEKTWRTDFLSVFVTDSHADNKDWEMTTGCLDITVKKGDSSESAITVVHNPDLSNGESVSDFTKHTMTVKTRSVDNLSFEKGNTLPTGVKLKSKRKLIAIANRVALRLDGKVEMFLFNDDELVETWFHEIACHAGRNAQGLPDTHNDKTVNSYTTEIKEMFPETKTIPTVGAVIKEFLKA